MDSSLSACLQSGIRTGAERLIVASCLIAMLCGCSTAGGRSGGAYLPDRDSVAAQTYVSHCGVCHAVPHPARLDYQGWVSLLPLMEQRMAERGMMPLTAEDRQQILAYLQENAR